MEKKEDLQIQRIKNVFDQKFSQYIDGKYDTNSPEDKNVFYSRCVAAMTLIHLTGINYENCNEYITDGFNDYGIDCIYINNKNRKILFIQSKLVNDGNKAPDKGEILKFLDGVERILNFKFERMNPKIIRMKNELESTLLDASYKIEVILSYTGVQMISKECLEGIENFKNKINCGVEDFLVSHKIFNKTDIYQMILDSSNAQKIDISNIKLQNWGMICDGEIPTAYYGTVDVAEIADLWKKYNIKLFQKNIRFFKGNSDVNSGMKDVLINEPENFIYYNNGIKIIAQEMRRNLANSTDRNVAQISLKDISIVNGAQTVGCIGEMYACYPEIVKKAKVFVNIISIESMHEEYEWKITKLSNTQNKIESKDFIGLDSKQEKLKREFATIGIEYVYKDGNYYLYNENKIYVEEVIIAAGCYLNDVENSTMIKRAIGSVYDDLNKPPYASIFDFSFSVEMLLNLVKIYRLSENYMKEKSKDITGNQKLILIHGNRFLLHMIFQKLKEEKWNIEKELPSNSKLYEVIDYLVNIIEDATIDMFKFMYPPNIFKTNAPCIEIKRRITNIGDEVYSKILNKNARLKNSTEQLNLFTMN